MLIFADKQGTDPEVDSYSGFWDNARQAQTKCVGLEEKSKDLAVNQILCATSFSLFQVLFDADVDRVFVCGLGYDCAVGRTARDAATYGAARKMDFRIPYPHPSPPPAPGFTTFIVTDATASFDNGWAREMDLEVQAAGVRQVIAAELGRLPTADGEDGGTLPMAKIIERTTLTRALSQFSKTPVFTSSA